MLAKSYHNQAKQDLSDKSKRIYNVKNNEQIWWMDVNIWWWYSTNRPYMYITLENGITYAWVNSMI